MNFLVTELAVLRSRNHRPAIDFVGQRKAKRAWSFLKSRGGDAEEGSPLAEALLVVVGVEPVLRRRDFDHKIMWR